MSGDLPAISLAIASAQALPCAFAAEADFATQRDVSRRKRDIKTIVLKVRLENPNGAYMPGMTAEVLISPDQMKGTRGNQVAKEHP